MASAEVWSIALSIVALLFSGYSVALQRIRDHADGPKVEVEGWITSRWEGGPDGRDYWVVSLRVANTGRSPVTIERAAMAIEMPEGYTLTVAGDSTDVKFPLRLEGLDSRDWDFRPLGRSPEWVGLQSYPLAQVVGSPQRGKRGARRTSRLLVEGARRTVVGPGRAF